MAASLPLILGVLLSLPIIDHRLIGVEGIGSDFSEPLPRVVIVDALPSRMERVRLHSVERPAGVPVPHDLIPGSKRIRAHR